MDTAIAPLGSKLTQENAAYVNNLKFDKFDIKKDLNDKRNFSCTITSKRRTGKSVLLKNLCFEIKDWYNSVYVFSMSANLQPDLFDFVPKENVIDGFNEEKLQQIWNAQMEMVMKLKKINVPPEEIPKVLILFDDIIGCDKVRHSEILNNFFILGRHLHFAVIIISQTISGKYGLPSVIRSNTDVAISFFLDAEYCRESFCEQYLSARNKKIGALIYNKLTREVPYQAIVCLNCVVDQDITKCVKTYKAKEKLPKFKMGKVKDLKHSISFGVSPATGINQMPNFLPPIAKSKKT